MRVTRTIELWTAAVLKVLGCVGFALSLALAVPALGLGGEFNPVMFGGSLAAATGGFTLDALNALKSGRE